MKKILKSLVLVAAAVATLTSCEKAPETNPTPEEFTLTVNAALPAPESGRTYLGDKDGDAYPVLWSEDDKIRLYEVSYASNGGQEFTSGTSQSKYKQSESIVISDDHTTATFPEISLASPIANADYFDYIAYYGNTESMGMYRRYNNPPYLKVTIPNAQTPKVVDGAVQFDSAAALMAAKSLSHINRQAELNFTFKHLVAYGMLNITNFNSGSDKVVSVTFGNTNHNIVGQSRYLYTDANDATVIDSSNVYKEVTINVAALDVSSANFVVPFAIAPTTFASGDEIFISVATESGTTYTKEITLTDDQAKNFDFKQGTIVDFSANFNGVLADTPTTIADILAGANDEVFKVDGTVGAVTKQSFILVDATGVLNIYVKAAPKVDGVNLEVGDNVTVKGTRGEYQHAVQLTSPTITARDGQSYTLPTPEEFDAAKLDAYYANPETIKLVKISGVYSVSGTYYNLNVAGLNRATGGSFYQLPDAVIGDIQSGTPVVVEGYLVGYNNSGYVNIHAVKMEADNSPYLLVAEDEYQIAAAGGNVEIEVSTNVTGWTAAVTGIAGATATPAEGKVTVTIPANTADEERTATVTLSGTGVANVVVTIKQKGLVTTNDTYELVTSVDQLKDGVEILIVAKNGEKYYAMNNTLSSKKYPTSAVSVNNNKIMIASDNSTIGVMTLGASNDKWTLQCGSAYIAYDSSTNFKTVASVSDNKGEWTIALDANSQATITNVNSTRVFLMNNNNIFGAYAASNIGKDGYFTPQIFKKVN
ncbi:MAG: BACON domain-containing protein [Tidjanibacter sp.]|nr:BACON domain-containing protein [Tidjanibacter sp.]